MIRCDCGFEVAEEGEEALLTGAQIHARDSHGMDLPAELVRALLGLAARSDAGARSPPATGPG